MSANELVRFDFLEQGSDEWHELRATCQKTASRTPIVLGLSPFSNIEKLAQEIKFGIKPYYSKAMQDGNNFEDYVRDMANEYFEDVFMPTVGVRNGFLASLDGINLEEDTIIEIKVSEKTFDEVKSGKVPDYYYSQIQHQMMVFSSVEKAYLVAYSKSRDEIAVSDTIKKDDDYHNIICNEWAKFKEYLATYEMPQVDNLEDNRANSLALELFEINEQKKQLELKEKELKEKILEFVTTDKTTIGNLTISKSKRKTVEYAKLLNELNVNDETIEKYTKYSDDSYSFRFSK